MKQHHIVALVLISSMTILFSGCAKIKMVKGDIPLTTIPAGAFIDPPAQYKMVFQPILFDYDHSAIRPDMEPYLTGIANWLKSHPAVLLRVEGNCDERGSEEYNLALGERRALSVRQFIVEQGISPTRITTISYGEEHPVNSGHNELAWAQNRRAEFKLSQ